MCKYVRVQAISISISIHKFFARILESEADFRIYNWKSNLCYTLECLPQTNAMIVSIDNKWKQAHLSR